MESMLLAGETFTRLQETTGLLKVSWRNRQERTQLEEKLANELNTVTASGKTVIASSSDGEPSTAVHLVPLIHRDENGRVVPAEIEIPYGVLGGIKIFALLRSTRSAYMRQLIEETRRRLAMAWQVYNEHRRMLEEWLSFSELEKAKRCEGQALITITGSYDFRRAVVVPLPKPHRISMREYEDTVRPGIVQQAKAYGEAFDELCNKLRSLDASGGQADTLTFKLLIDSMIRKAPLHVESQELQNEYQKWVENASVPVWGAIEKWAREHKTSLAFLASDSVVFNCSLNAQTNTVVIRPWVAIDPNDFTAIADQAAGSIAIFPAGKARKLSDAVIPNSDVEITDLISLRDRFDGWLNAALQAQLQASDSLTSKTASANRKILAVVGLERAKNLLFRGLADEALACLSSVRNADLTPIYFWGAVACQLKADMQGRWDAPQYARDDAGRVQMLDEVARRRYMLEKALQKIHVALRPQESGRQLTLASGSSEYLNQLRAKDPEFVKSFLSPDWSERIVVLQEKSLCLSKEEWTAVRAALAAVASLELLQLAQEITRTANRLPASGTVTRHVKDEIYRLLALANHVSACVIPEGAQLKSLNEFLVSG